MLKKKNKKSSYSLWRKIHIYCFGYFLWPSIFVSVLFIVISVTGILYNHHHDIKVLKEGRISTTFLPDSYQERLDKTRKAQGLEDLFPEEATRIPVMWLVQDLHTGDILGPWGRFFYDLVGVAFIILAGSGCYLFFKMRIRTRKKQKGDL